MKTLITNMLIGTVLFLAATGAASAQTQVDLNTATSGQLQTLSGIGPSLAERILEFRAKNGPFKKIEDLMNVRGIGQKKFDSLREKITVGGPARSEKTPKAGGERETATPKGPPLELRDPNVDR